MVAVEPASSRVLQGHSHRVHALTGIGTGLQVPMVEQLEPGEPFVEGTSMVYKQFLGSTWLLLTASPPKKGK